MSEGGESPVMGSDTPDAAFLRTRAEAVLVTAPRCHLCDDAKVLLKDLQAEYPLIVREVDLSSDEGMRLARKFGMPFPPLLVIDNVLFGHGRISRRKLTRFLDSRTGQRR